MTSQEQPVNREPQGETEDTGKGLRAQLEKAHEEIRGLKGTQKGQAFKDAGLDVTTGLGKAIFKEYDGDLTSEAVSAYATEEYGYQPAPGQDLHPQAQNIQAAQTQLDVVGQQAGSIQPPTEATELQEAETSGDYQKAMSIKAKQMESWFRGAPS